MFVQTVVNNKYLGHFVMVLYIVATIALPPAGFQDYLYRFGETPPVTYPTSMATDLFFTR